MRCKRWAQAEGVAAIRPLDAAAAAKAATLLCFVLVGPESQHAFTSRYDFGPWPLLSGVTSLQPEVLQVRLSGRLRLRCSCVHARRVSAMRTSDGQLRADYALPFPSCSNIPRVASCGSLDCWKAMGRLSSVHQPTSACER